MLYIDVETYNAEKDISAGTYEYARTAEALIVTYAFGDGPVQIWDLTTGQPMPDDLAQGFNDFDLPITAHNCQFDRTVIRETLGVPLRIERCRCTMVKAMAHGFPGSLDQLGRILGLPQDQAKLKDGKRLIHRFCKPAPKNHKAERYDRQSHPEEWQNFCDYAVRDIEAMREIDKRLPDWNYRGAEMDMYHLDQRINDRGFLVDRELVEAGSVAAVEEKNALAARFIELTGGVVEKPTQRERFRTYLNTTFGLELRNTQSQTFKELIGAGDLHPDCKELMRISIMANKASTAKYRALEPSISPDDRFRGGLQFSGAPRTRRWCLTGDHEVLTKEGWTRLDTWTGGEIIQFNPKNQTVAWHSAEKVEFEYEGPLITVDHSRRVSAAMTPEHTMLSDSGPVLANNADGRTISGVPRGGHFGDPRGIRDAKKLPFTRTRLMVAANHDGHVTKSGALVWSFVKGRKIKRLQQQLDTMGIKYRKRSRAPQPGACFYVSAKDCPEWLGKKTFGPWLLTEGHDPKVFVRELAHWDGHQPRSETFEVCAKNKVDAEWMVTMAHLAGASGALHHRVNDAGRAYWYAAIHLSGSAATVKPEHWGRSHHKGRVYCAVTQTGFFLVRRNNVIHVTGNSGRNFQPHNLPSRGLPTQDSIEQYIRALKSGVHDLLFDNLMLYGSAALRGVLVASPGKRLVVADLSNIEGRANAWLAGETWKLDAFDAFDRGEGPDLYKVTAGRILNKPVEDVSSTDRNAIGKVAELSMGYAGGVNALQNFAKGKMAALLPLLGKTSPEFVAAARKNFRDWGEERNEGKTPVDEWVASETVKLAWRDRHPAITKFWYACETAARNAIKSPGKAYWAGPHVLYKKVIHANHGYLLARMPSGNFLAYYAPRVEPDGKLTHMGVNSMTRQWGRQSTFGGKLVENLSQSLSRDILAQSMPAVEAAGYEILLTVHDEIVTEAPITDQHTAEHLAGLMSARPDWADGFPLAAAGFVANRYKKGD